MVAAVMDRQRQRKNLRTAIVLALIALASFAAFFYKVWHLG
jgi:hypothetical protein